MPRLMLPAAMLLAAATACAPPAPQAPPPPAGPQGPQAGAQPPQQQPEQICTLIGCENGWSVEVVGAAALPATYTVRARIRGEVVASVECSPTNPCGDRVFLQGVTADSADLEIVGEGVALSWAVQPEYSIVQPNGPQCPPTCRQARVQVRL